MAGSPSNSVGYIGAPTHRTLLEGLPAIYVRPDAEPSIHRGSVQGLSDAEAVCNAMIACRVLDFQARALHEHDGLRREQIILRSATRGVTTRHLRYLDREKDMDSFVPEISAPVKERMRDMCG
ncbi:hypothetical protein IW148_004505 [Coemansia sp. RSA 1199]|nr:hypothetical protein IW148_004505 [Coemansia sp. RSA 1199]